MEGFGETLKDKTEHGDYKNIVNFAKRIKNTGIHEWE